MPDNDHIYGGLGPNFWANKPLIGMVHLLPLPGTVGAGADYVERAVADARALVEGGADAIIVENFWDAPFCKDTVPPHTVAAMTRAVQAVRAAAPSVPVGVNVLRNDARAAIAIAHVCGAHFVRVNVYVGAAVTDQGLIEGAARTSILYRRELDADVAIWADIFVKHAAQLGVSSLEDTARDAVLRGRADALIISGSATGAHTNPTDIARVKAALPNTRVLIGSGFDASTAAALLKHADGAITGTSLKLDGVLSNPVDPARVRAVRRAMAQSLPPHR